MIRCSNFPALREGKVPNQANDDLRLHQGAPRAAGFPILAFLWPGWGFRLP